MKSLLTIALVLLPCLARADEVVRSVATRGDLTLLTKAQQSWLSQFETDATVGSDPETAAKWLEHAAASARDVRLAATADYLLTSARVLRGDSTVEDAERAMRRTLDQPLLVILRFDGRTISDITICTCDPARTRELERSMEQFERSLPGFVESWLDRSPTRAMTRIANLHYRVGKNANAASTGTYLPFDRALTPLVGRTWIVYDNMVRANWWAEGVRPVAQRLLPMDFAKVTAGSLVAWYATRPPVYDAGPQLTPAQRDRLGSSRDALLIIKGDVLSALIGRSSDEQIATLTTLAFYALHDALRGDAPPAHRAASTAEINWLVDHGALRFDEPTATWTFDYTRCRSAVNELGTAVMDIERSGDAARAEALLARYGSPTDAITRTMAELDRLPQVKVQTLFVR